MITKKNLEGEWYHGDERKTDFINRNYFDVTDYTRDRNAMGPGIYFTRLKYQANGYAGDSGYVYTVTVDLDPKRTLEDNTRPNAKVLKKFIDRCPDKELLYNYSPSNFSIAAKKAIDMNMESRNMLDAVLGLYNDLYQMDAVLFAKVMTEAGYDALYHKVSDDPDAIHLIVYNPSIINIVDEEHRGVKESKTKIYQMKHIRTFNQLNENESIDRDDANISVKKAKRKQAVSEKKIEATTPMKKVSVLACAYNRQTGEAVGQPRWEDINLSKNVMFKDCESILDVHDKYENFWNRLNPDSAEIVFVHQIKIIN